MIALLKSTFANNPLSIVITVLGVLYVTDNFIFDPISDWWDARESRKQQQVLIDRCTDRQQAQTEIRNQADEARSSADNSFINQ